MPLRFGFLTPVLVVSGMSAATRRPSRSRVGPNSRTPGFFKAIALDKTGTITEGKPNFLNWRVWCNADEAVVWHVAAGLATCSDHPVSKAIAASPSLNSLEVQDFKALPGKGEQG